MPAIKDTLEKAFAEAANAAVNPEVLNALKERKSLQHPLLRHDSGSEVTLGQSVAEGIQTIIANLGRNKYLYSILITALAKKIEKPTQDIRIAQTGLDQGYSNRSTDEIHVTPFLKRNGLTHCAASGAESGRNFERPIPFTLDFPGRPQGKGNREAFLGILHAAEVEGVDPLDCITLLMALDLVNKKQDEFVYPPLAGLTVDRVHKAILSHHSKSKGRGRARLPVLAIQAVYECLTQQVDRYQVISAKIRSTPNRHTGNDKEGWIGDIQVDRADGSPFEAVEVKSNRLITAEMITGLPRKFNGVSVDRYYILSTADPYIEPSSEMDVAAAIELVSDATGCQIIANGLYRSLWYYLRLISDVSEFIENYSRLIETDLDVQQRHKNIWHLVATDLSSPE